MAELWSLDRHPSPSPSHHGLHLVPNSSKTPPFFKTSRRQGQDTFFLVPDVIWVGQGALEWPLLTPLPPRPITIWLVMIKDEEPRTVIKLQSSSLHERTEPDLLVLHGLFLSRGRELGFAEATAQVLMNLALIPCWIYQSPGRVGWWESSRL